MHLVQSLYDGATAAAAHPRWRVCPRSSGNTCRRVSQSGERVLNQSPNLLVGSSLRNDAVSLEYSSRVGIHYKHWMIAGIEQDGVGSLWANALQREQFRPQLQAWTCEHAPQRTAVVLVEIRDK